MKRRKAADVALSSANRRNSLDFYRVAIRFAGVRSRRMLHNTDPQGSLHLHFAKCV